MIETYKLMHWKYNTRQQNDPSLEQEQMRAPTEARETMEQKECEAPLDPLTTESLPGGTVRWSM